MADEESDGAPPSPEPHGLNVGVYTCPHCGREVAVDPGERGPFIDCPCCGVQFALPPAAAEPQSEEDRAEHMAREALERDRQSELDIMRIRQLSTVRRAEIRVRSYLLIGAVGCLVGSIQLAIMAIRHIRRQHRWDWRAILLLLAATVALQAAGFFRKRWAQIGREMAKPMLQEPATPPDFSTLGDGKDHWKKLEDVE